MKNNKLFSVILALLVCFSLAVSVSATNDNELIFALESTDSSGAAVDTAKVKAGAEFTVTVNVEKNTGILAAVTSLKYDANVLELVSAENATTGVTVKKDTGVVTITLGDIRAILNPTTNTVFNSTGAVATLTFKVLADKDLTSAVELVVLPQQVVGSDRTCSVNPVGDKLDVVVISATHNHADYEAIDAENAVEATCTEPGKESDMLCGHCGAMVAEGEVIEIIEHTKGEVVVENNVDPTCTVAGKYDNVVYCTVCNGEASRETIEVEALGHTAGEVVVENNVDPTCTEAGKYDNVVYCTVCNAVVSRETITVDALGHTWGEWKTTTAPGCSTFGVQSRTCSSCGLVEEDASVPATGEHKFGDWKVTTEATTEAEGEETRTCECGAKETRPIEKLAPQPAPKNNTLVIVIIVVVVLAGAGVAAFFVLKNKKK